MSEPFSAADRDPGQERFDTIKNFFKTQHLPIYATSLRIRVFVCDDVSACVRASVQTVPGWMDGWMDGWIVRLCIVPRGPS